MIEATRNWFRRNRTKFAIGFGLLGSSYIVAQYVLGKIAETRERISSDRIARENLRRRFQQNQEDCTFTVLALLPTAADNILEALPVENITHELQQHKAQRLGRSAATSEISPSEASVPKSAPEDETKSQGEQSQGESSQTGEGSFVHTSQMGQSTFTGSESPTKPRKTKAQLWNELKIQSITRTFTMIYTLALLTLFTRIQLNLLGRRSYLSSVVSLASPPAHDTTINLENHDDDRAENSYGNDFETNRKFLTFSWWLLHRGWKDIKDKVEAAVTETFEHVNVREDLSFDRLSQLIVNIRKKIEGATDEERRSHKWLPYLLPPSDQETVVLHESGVLNPPSSSVTLANVPSSSEPSPSGTSTNSAAPGSIPPTDPLRRLLDETSDLIDSPTASHIMTLLLDALFSHLTDIVLRPQAFKLPPLPTSSNSQQPLGPNPADPIGSAEPRVIDVSETGGFSSDFASARAKLASVLATVTRQARALGTGVPNEYVQAMEGVRDLEAFAAVVYSSNFEVEGVRELAEERGEGPGGLASRQGSRPGSAGAGAGAGAGSGRIEQGHVQAQSQGWVGWAVGVPVRVMRSLL